MSIVVYHGSIETIEHPRCDLGRPNLDFGKGFYITDIKEQAITWANQLAIKKQAMPVLNCYTLDKDAYIKEAKSRIFSAYDEEWLNFVVGNRNGENHASEFDYVEGGVANDRIIDTVRLYMLGLMDIDTALKRLIMHEPNNQICLLNQELTDKYLIFNESTKL